MEKSARPQVIPPPECVPSLELAWPPDPRPGSLRSRSDDGTSQRARTPTPPLDDCVGSQLESLLYRPETRNVGTQTDLHASDPSCGTGLSRPTMKLISLTPHGLTDALSVLIESHEAATRAQRARADRLEDTLALRDRQLAMLRRQDQIRRRASLQLDSDSRW
jgi:hypothetical protein